MESVRRLAPAEVLSSVDLAGLCIASRAPVRTSGTPVHEALMLLEQENLVEIRARRRPQMAAALLQQVQEIYQIAQHLMVLEARLLVQRATDADIDEVRRWVVEMRRFADTGQVDEYFWAHVNLREILAGIVGNSTLRQILDSLALRTMVLRHWLLEQPGRLQASADGHERLLRAYEDRDADLAAALMASSTLSSLRAIERWHALSQG